MRLGSGIKMEKAIGGSLQMMVHGLEIHDLLA